ncbi:hypothetical protein JCM5353_002426 [Sporobolomyces roseus]
MIPSLPTELLRSILEQVEGEQDLANCCSTSKSFLHIARPLLYSTIRFYIRDWEEDSDDPDTECRLLDLLNESTWYLIESLEASSHLQVLVRRIVFTSDDSDGHVPSIPVEDSWVLSDVQYFSFIFRLSSLKEIVVEDPFRVDKVDELLANYQAIQLSSSRDRLIFPLHLIRERQLHENTDPSQLHAAYTSLEFCGSAAFWTQRAFNLLATSLYTLQILSIPFDETALLPDYHHLRHLELTFLLPASSYADLPYTVQELYASLPNLPVLETLLLSDPLLPDLDDPFPTGLLSQSLPPTLLSLSLEGHFIPDDPSKFVKALPQSSKLTRLNVKTGEEDWSDPVLEAECEKRGIKLTLDETWKAV